MSIKGHELGVQSTVFMGALLVKTEMGDRSKLSVPGLFPRISYCVLSKF